MSETESLLRPGNRVSLKGVVGSREVLRKRDGTTYLRACLKREGLTDLDVIWWSEADAPLDGEHVSVSGDLKEYRGKLELTARETRVIQAAGATSRAEHPHHRLIEYLIQCVEAEAALSCTFDLQSKEVALQVNGADPIMTPVATDTKAGVVTDVDVAQWCTKQLEQEATSILVGYPVVTGTIEDNGIEQGRIAPLFIVECELRSDGDEIRLERVDIDSEEFNPHSLTLLGVLDRDLRNELEDELNESGVLTGARSAGERLQSRVNILHARGVLDCVPVLDPLSLGEVATNFGISNALLFMPATSRNGPTKQLLDDLQELRRVEPQKLEHGPLGLALKDEQGSCVTALEVQPTITETNYRQDLAVSSAVKSMITVVTGPPGTGKSQVLVNAIAAAIANGESVLVASKNNAAVDVVIDRLERVAPDVCPIRTGNRTFRETAVSKLKTAIAIQSRPNLGATKIRMEWDGCASRIAQLHHAYRNRERLELEHSDVTRLLDEQFRELPPGLFSSLNVETSLQLQKLLDQSIGRPTPLLARLIPILRSRWSAKQSKLFFERLPMILPPHTAELLARDCPERDAAIQIELADSIRSTLARVAHVRALHEKQSAITQALDALPTIDELEMSMAGMDAERQKLGRILVTSLVVERKIRAPVQAIAAGSRVLTTIGADVAGRWPTRILGAVFADLLPLVPVWALTSLSVRGNIPLVPGLFDLVIIDEASQSDVASILPLLYRAKRAVVIGDPHQLTHVTRLKSQRAERLANVAGLSSKQLLDWHYVRANAFELARRRIAGTPIFLDQHFRCHPAIIEFSNRHRSLYDGTLVVCTDPEIWRGSQGIEWQDVRGAMKLLRSGSRQNELEAHAVVQTVAALLSDPACSGASIGIVSPYSAQVALIQNRLSQELPAASSVAVRTAHRFQGDERDIMIYSPAIAGPPGELGGLMALKNNLVNVALTRAKRRLIVVGDLQTCLGSQTILRDLAQYCVRLRDAGAYTPFEVTVRDELARRGFDACTGERSESDRIGVTCRKGSMKLAVQCDGHPFKTEMDTDSESDNRLREKGYVVRRLSPRQIGRGVVRCVDMLVS